MDHDINPYAAPEAISEDEAADFETLRVDGNLVCVGRRVQLPDICVLTGDTTDLVRLKISAGWCSPFVIIALVVSPLIGLILYVALRKQAWVTMSMNRSVRSKRLRTVFRGVLLLVAALALFVWALAVMSAISWPLVLLIMSLTVTGFVFLGRGMNPVKVKKYRKPDRFWLQGFKEPFFDTLADDPNFRNGVWHPPNRERGFVRQRTTARSFETPEAPAD